MATMSSSSSSFVMATSSPSTEQDDVDSLPSDSSDDSEDELAAQREWEANLAQLQLVLTMVIIPFAGKYFGRKFAYWSTPPLYTTTACLLATRGGSRQSAG